MEEASEAILEDIGTANLDGFVVSLLAMHVGRGEAGRSNDRPNRKRWLRVIAWANSAARADIAIQGERPGHSEAKRQQRGEIEQMVLGRWAVPKMRGRRERYLKSPPQDRVLRESAIRPAFALPLFPWPSPPAPARDG